MFGLGLRHTHFNDIINRLEEDPSSLQVDFYEVITENFFETNGRPLKVLEKIREHFPISFHGVSMSIASKDEIDFNYLEKLKRLEDRIDPFLVSDHLCWTGLKGKNLHNLLPFPYTKENLKFIASKIQTIQEFLKRPLMLENLSAYIAFKDSIMSESQFLQELHKETGCKLVLDLNNLYVNSQNQNFNPEKWLQEIPSAAVHEIHLAGFSDMGSFLFDTHSCPVWDPVWELYKNNKAKFPEAVTLIEWDENIPTYEELILEVKKAKHYGSL